MTARGSEFGKIGVLAGGPSSEREISLRSGRAVYEALLRLGHEVILMDVKDGICDIIGGNAIDVAFIALHGKFGEDGTVQGILERMGIPYTGSGVEASRLALDKIATKVAFEKAGIPTPEYFVLNNPDDGLKGFDRLGWPVVVKPQFEGSSIGLSIVSSEKDLAGRVREAFACGGKVVLEGFVAGRELTVGMLNDEPLPVVEIVTKSGVYDYHAKYKDPGTQYLVPAPIDENAAEAAKRLGRIAHKALGCRSFSRVDIMMDKKGAMYVLEVNTIPGMTERSLLPKAALAAGIDFGEMCTGILEDAVKYHRKGIGSYHGSKEK